MEEPSTTAVPPETPEPSSSTPPSPEKKTERPKLLWSAEIGRPSYVLDPADLPRQYDLVPNKLGDRIRLIDSNTVVKYGSGVKLAEAEVMKLVSEKTTIPIPKVEAAYVLEGKGYIIMSYEPGERFDDYWDAASEDVREGLIAQLKGYVSQLREVKGSFIGRVDYTPCQDAVFMWDYVEGTHEYGPYDDQEALNEGLVKALENRNPPRTAPLDTTSSGYNSWWKVKQLARSFRSKEIVLTHGDLQAGNMLVRDDGTVVLLDWGLSGFYPDYWEFYRAHFNGAWRCDFLRQIERFIPPFYMEAFVMRYIFDQILC